MALSYYSVIDFIYLIRCPSFAWLLLSGIHKVFEYLNQLWKQAYQFYLMYLILECYWLFHECPYLIYWLSKELRGFFSLFILKGKIIEYKT